jgi:hypothetical protein
MTNPFIFDRPLAPDDLIDREDETRRLVELAEGGHNSRLSAPRRYGKTTLLGRVRRDAERIGITTVGVDFYGVISLEEIAVRIENAYRQSLTGALAKWYARVVRTWRPRVKIGVGGAGLEVGPRADAEVDRLLTELLDLPIRVFERTGTRTLVVFDEFQALLGADDRADAIIRSRIEHHVNQASYIFAGSHPGLMAELFGSRSRPLFDQARPLRLGPLDDADISSYIDARFAATGRDPGAGLEPLLDLVRGHPQRAMLVGHHLWEHTSPGQPADAQAWLAAQAAVFGELQEVFERSWELLSANQRRGIAAVAWGGPWGGGDSLYSASTLARFKLTKGTARDVRAALLKTGDIEEPEPGALRLVDPLFEAWIASGRRPLY